MSMEPTEGLRQSAPLEPPRCPAPPPLPPVTMARLYRIAKMLVVVVIGGTLILLGLALVWVPGPFTLPLVLLGLAVLATEFVWARRLLQRMKSTATTFTVNMNRRFGWRRWIKAAPSNESEGGPP